MNRTGVPADHLTSGTWPNGEIRKEPGVATARHISAKVAALVNDHGGTRAMSRTTGVPRSTLGQVLDGSAWPSVRTIAILEEHYGPIWPRP